MRKQKLAIIRRAQKGLQHPGARCEFRVWSKEAHALVHCHKPAAMYEDITHRKRYTLCEEHGLFVADAAMEAKCEEA